MLVELELSCRSHADYLQPYLGIVDVFGGGGKVDEALGMGSPSMTHPTCTTMISNVGVATEIYAKGLQ